MSLRFTIRQLEYFLAVAECGSIAAASEKVNVSSPSISAAIVQLEDEFGLQLFVRKHAHGLSPTQGGLQFTKQARKVLAEATRLNSLANDITGKVRGPLNVGCLLTFAQIILPQLRRRFVDKNTEVEFHQFQRTQTELFEDLRSAALDVALTYDLNIPADLTFIPLVSLPPYALMAANHPLARHESVTARQLAEHPMILLDLPVSSEYFLSIFEHAGHKLKIVERTRDMAVTQSLVANGFGYSLANIRPTSDRAPDGKKLRYVPLKGPVRPMKMGLLLSQGAQSSLTVRSFVDHCKQHITAETVLGLKLRHV
jgi:DNA-binding transcriptional LysR family regulator